MSLRHDPVPAWVKINLQLHRPRRSWLGFGRLRCEWCGERWGRHGCYFRESAARMFARTAEPAQRRAALATGEVTEADLALKRPRPSGRHRRRPPRPHPGPAFRFPVVTA
ncbi:MAG TPA: hypothetical protein VFU12_12720 [Glycomyces sp.]|nr:hypothetical protein [Glycomyces sp.]